MHANARLTVAGRRTLVERIASGRPVAHVAAEMGVSRKTAHLWWRRFQEEGVAGLADRSSRPHRIPHKTSARMERRIDGLRRREKLGPARIGHRLGMPASTVHRVLCRRGLNRLAWLDRPTGRTIRRIRQNHPGELVHMDVKKLGRIPPGGGWRMHGWETRHRGRTRTRRIGYVFVHSVVDGYSRLAYSEVLDDEKAVTAIGFFQRAVAWFADHGIHIDAVLTDNGSPYVSKAFKASCAELGIQHRRTRPHRPQTNGKVERFNRTLIEEWAYVRSYRSENARVTALARFLHTYNHHRCHTALGGQPPVNRVTNLPRHHT